MPGNCNKLCVPWQRKSIDSAFMSGTRAKFGRPFMQHCQGCKCTSEYCGFTCGRMHVEYMQCLYPYGDYAATVQPQCCIPRADGQTTRWQMARAYLRDCCRQGYGHTIIDRPSDVEHKSGTRYKISRVFNRFSTTHFRCQLDVYLG